MRCIHSSSQRASSRTSGTPLPASGIAAVPSASGPASAASRPCATSARSHVSSTWCTAIPPLTTYLPWSPASYQPPRTSNVSVAGPARVPGLRRLAADRGVPGVGCHAQVPGRARVLVADERTVDLDAAARQVEVAERVRRQVRVQVGVDGERVAGLAVGDEREALAGRVDLVEKSMTCTFSSAVRSSPRGVVVPVATSSPVCVEQLPRQRVGLLGHQRRALRAGRQVARAGSRGRASRSPARTAPAARRCAPRRRPRRTASRPARHPPGTRPAPRASPSST